MLELSKIVGHPASVTENCLMWGKLHTHLVTTGSEVQYAMSVVVMSK